MFLPLEYAINMQKLLEQDYPYYLQSLEEEKVNGLRINPLKITKQAWESIAPFSLDPVPWCSNGYYYNKSVRPAKHPYYAAGLFYLQEPSAMLPGEVLDVAPGDNVLDICAAPGGKSTQLGAALSGKGFLLTNDISPSRGKALLKNIELFGISNAVVTSESPERLCSKLPEFFDKILIDAPCSGEGMFRKEPAVRHAWGEKMSAFCTSQQKNLLNRCANMLKPGGKMVYSTCTFSPEEDERQISDFLETHEDFSLLPIAMFPGFDQGHTEWANGRDLQNCVRLWPHKIKGEGHFVALMQKKQQKQPESHIVSPMPASEKAYQDFIDFAKQSQLSLPEGIYQIYGSYLNLLPAGAPDLSGLRILRSGLLLGELKKGRFEPFQALAMTLNSSNWNDIISFSSEDSNVIRYLKGETIAVPNQDNGWKLVAIDGFPLGFGKMQNGRLKNKYCTGWRWNA